MIIGSEQDSRAVVWKNYQYHGIRELGFTQRPNEAFVLHLWSTAASWPRGEYMTTIPISPWEYRRARPTKCQFRRQMDRVIIWDDWGHSYEISADPDVLTAIEQDLRLHCVPEFEPGDQ